MYYILQREYILWKSSYWQLLTAIAFLCLGVLLFILAIGPHAITPAIGAGIIWVLCLLSTMLGASHLLQEDYQVGALEQLYISALSPWQIIMGKAFSVYIFYNIPLIIASILPMIWFAIPYDEAILLWVSLLVGTIALSFIFTLGMLLTLGAKMASFLAIFVVLPFLIPTLIFSTISFTYQDYHYIALLGGLSVTTILCTVLFGTLALKELLSQ